MHHKVCKYATSSQLNVINIYVNSQVLPVLWYQIGTLVPQVLMSFDECVFKCTLPHKFKLPEHAYAYINMVNI